MKIPVSWADYWLAICILCGLYYVIVLLVYYQKDILSWRHRPIRRPVGTQPPQHPPVTTTLKHSPAHEEDLSPHVHDFTDELKALLLQLAAEQSDKVTLVSSVARLLHKYPQFNKSAFQEALTNLIVVEAAERCSVVLDHDDQLSLWQ